jgi:tetratricopeptide (TPR) repeat protein
MPTMIELLDAAREAAPDQDHGGPDRVLALLYLRAPGWPTGPGDPDLGYEFALKAAEIDPDFPPNHLVMGEALAAVDRKNEAIAAYRTALHLAEAQQESGGRDAREWLEEARTALSRLGA